MFVRQLARPPVVDLDCLDARALYLHALAPSQLMQLPETSYQIKITFLDNRLSFTRQPTQRTEIAVIHVRVRDEHGVERR